MSALPRIGAFVVLAVVASFAFVLSFTALSDLAAHNAVRPSQAWMIPVVVDATIIGATLAVVAAPRRRWFPWTILAVAASLSVAGNMAHAWSFGPIAIVIAAVPPVFLLAMTELAVVLTRRPSRSRPLLKSVPAPTALADLAGSFRAKYCATPPDVYAPDLRRVTA